MGSGRGLWQARAMERWGPLVGHWVGDKDGSGPIVVLLHGFGAPGTDLVPLARELRLPDRFRFLFLQAPLTMPPPFTDGRAWWMVDVGRFQMALMTGQLEPLERETPDGLSEARAQLAEAFEALRASQPRAALVLGGFSQGSMLALDHALYVDTPLEALVLMSSTLIHRDGWLPRMPDRKGLKVFQSHGQQDPILPFVQAQKLRGHLEDAGFDVTWHPFSGQHQIPTEVLQHLHAFLLGAVPEPAEPR